MKFSTFATVTLFAGASTFLSACGGTNSTAADEAAIKDVNAKRLKAAEVLLVEADYDYKRKNDAAALRSYLSAVALLSRDHPRFAEVNQKIQELRK